MVRSVVCCKASKSNLIFSYPNKMQKVGRLSLTSPYCCHEVSKYLHSVIKKKERNVRTELLSAMLSTIRGANYNESLTEHLKFPTCPICDTGSEWTIVIKAHQYYQALVSKAACSVSLLLQSLLPDTPDEPTPLTLGRKAYVSLVLENHQNI